MSNIIEQFNPNSSVLSAPCVLFNIFGGRSNKRILACLTTLKKAKKPVSTDNIRVNPILKLDRAEKTATEDQEAELEAGKSFPWTKWLRRPLPLAVKALHRPSFPTRKTRGIAFLRG